MSRSTTDDDTIHFADRFHRPTALNGTPIRVLSSIVRVVVAWCCGIRGSKRPMPFRGSSLAPNEKIENDLLQRHLSTGKLGREVSHEQSPQPQTFTVLRCLDLISP